MRSTRTSDQPTVAVSLGVMRELMGRHAGQGGQGSGGYENLIESTRQSYAPPWELAMQRWLDAVAPGPRSFARPSRRGTGDGSVVLPGRTREGWAMHIVLDTSGSMASDLPAALGAIGAFCESAGVSMVRIVQCDTTVTRIDWLEPEELEHFTIAGYGGSDMSPGIEFLADDPDVTAALVLTDGCIGYPANEPPFRILWGVIGGYRFEPPYGEVVVLERPEDISSDRY